MTEQNRPRRLVGWVGIRNTLAQALLSKLNNLAIPGTENDQPAAGAQNQFCLPSGACHFMAIYFSLRGTLGGVAHRHLLSNITSCPPSHVANQRPKPNLLTGIYFCPGIYSSPRTGFAHEGRGWGAGEQATTPHALQNFLPSSARDPPKAAHPIRNRGNHTVRPHSRPTTELECSHIDTSAFNGCTAEHTQQISRTARARRKAKKKRNAKRLHLTCDVYRAASHPSSDATTTTRHRMAGPPHQMAPPSAMRCRQPRHTPGGTP